jgi:hypothetical protein
MDRSTLFKHLVLKRFMIPLGIYRTENVSFAALDPARNGGDDDGDDDDNNKKGANVDEEDDEDEETAKNSKEEGKD